MGEEGGVTAIVAGCNQSFAHASVYWDTQRWRRGLSPQPSTPEGSLHTLSDNTLPRGGGNKGIAIITNPGTRAHVDSADRQMPNSRVRGA